MTPASVPVDEQIHALWKARPRSRFRRASLGAIALLTACAWGFGGFNLQDTFSARRAENFTRFLQDVRPHDLQGRAWDPHVVWRWVGRTLDHGGLEATVSTLAISILAILLAALLGFALCLGAARNFAVPSPFSVTARSPPPLARFGWRSLILMTRTLLILLRSVPEYILAFLILGMLGGPAWPAVLALALHNAGILGRLDAETIENVESRPLRALRALGAGRMQIATVGIWPAILPRALLYFFYRWETCVREATVLGLLGLASLGRLIDDAQVAFRYDDMLLYVLMGAAIVLAGDLVSAVARRIVRRAS